MENEVFSDRLRTAINVIPQEPFLMQGTIRLNADPFGLASDEDIKNALTRVGLWELFMSRADLTRT